MAGATIAGRQTSHSPLAKEAPVANFPCFALLNQGSRTDPDGWKVPDTSSRPSRPKHAHELMSDMSKGCAPEERTRNNFLARIDECPFVILANNGDPTLLKRFATLGPVHDAIANARRISRG